jgi:hypothetical protein
MINQKCLHKEWLLIKIKGLRGFKIWQCKQCKLLLKEKTKGFHEVFILRNPAQKLDILQPVSPITELKKPLFYSDELNKTLLPDTSTTANSTQIQLKKQL